MNRKQIFIENMVCPRCKRAVRDAFLQHKWTVHTVELGCVEVSPPPRESGNNLEMIYGQLTQLGFGVASDRSGLVSRVKGVVIDYVARDAAAGEDRLSTQLSDALDLSYEHLSRTFSEAEGRTIDEFYQAHRLERARRLLVRTTEPISQVGYRLRYGSAAHFSTAFKKQVGCSPSQFRAAGTYAPRDLTRL